MLERVSFALNRAYNLDPQKSILVAVSGGPDSLCLLDVLWRLGYSLVVAHLDHSLRPEAQEEAKAVQELAQRMNFPCILGKEDVAGFANEQGLSIEEAARNLRYRFLFQQAELHNVQAVAVGHSADDQVETVLMHLLRGSGLDGLCGMEFYSLPHAWSKSIPLVRPLLGVWREEILAHVTQHNLQPSLDASNQDTRYYRNRLRQELIPHLEDLNPGARQRIWRMAELLREDSAVLEAQVEATWQVCCQEMGTGFVAFDASRLQIQPLAIQRRLIRRGIARLHHGLQDIDYASVERTLDFLRLPTRSKQRDLIAGLRLELGQGCLWLADWKADLPGAGWPQLKPGSQFQLHLPGEISLPGGWLLRGEVVPVDAQVYQQATANPDPFQVWLDLERVELPLLVRARLAGDRFQPLGMNGHSLKLSDFMINRKLPRRARQGWPLVISEEQIACGPGFHPCELAAIQASTANAVHLQLHLSSEPIQDN